MSACDNVERQDEQQPLPSRKQRDVGVPEVELVARTGCGRRLRLPTDRAADYDTEHDADPQHDR